MTFSSFSCGWTLLSLLYFVDTLFHKFTNISVMSSNIFSVHLLPFFCGLQLYMYYVAVFNDRIIISFGIVSNAMSSSSVVFVFVVWLCFFGGVSLCIAGSLLIEFSPPLYGLYVPVSVHAWSSFISSIV